MNFFSAAELLPSYPPPYRSIEDIIISLWIEYLDLELNSPYSTVVTAQRMIIIELVINYWENKQYEIFCYEFE
tara:strand:+ start:6164 stop:6382 length:219 start_codon:yes stop_codon:yes gene_type:complete